MGIFERKPNVEQMKAERDIEGLISALRHRDQEVQKSAAQALGNLRDSKAVEALIKALDDKNSDVEWAAGFALAEIAKAARDERAAQAAIQWHSRLAMRLMGKGFVTK